MLDRNLLDIRAKVEAGGRLSAADGELLFSPEVDLHALGELADAARRRKNGDVVYYNRNLHLNPTNVCIFRCSLCAYSRDEDDPRAYVMSQEETLGRAREAVEAGCTELHIVGGVHPRKTFDWYLGMIRDLHAAFPRLHLKAWTAAEIDHFAQSTRRPVRSILEDLIAAGLGSMPGGGAEIFDSHVRTEICPRKADADTWLVIHRTAHELGLRTNASMLYGHIECVEHRVDHLMKLRNLQAETGGFQAFVPLAFHPENTRLSYLRRTSALEDLRVVAVSRLMLDNFDHIKAYWISLGVGTAQTALAYGADDLDGTVRHERIHHDAGATSPEVLTIDQLRGTHYRSWPRAGGTRLALPPRDARCPEQPVEREELRTTFVSLPCRIDKGAAMQNALSIMPRCHTRRQFLARAGAAGALAVGLPVPAVADAAQREWGDLKGRFLYDGQPPERRKLKVDKDLQFTAKLDIRDESLMVGPDGGLANVYVYLRNAKAPISPELETAAATKVVLDNRGWIFQPHCLKIWCTKQTLVDRQFRSRGPERGLHAVGRRAGQHRAARRRHGHVPLRPRPGQTGSDRVQLPSVGAGVRTAPR